METYLAYNRIWLLKQQVTFRIWLLKLQATFGKSLYQFGIEKKIPKTKYELKNFILFVIQIIVNIVLFLHKVNIHQINKNCCHQQQLSLIVAHCQMQTNR